MKYCIVERLSGMVVSEIYCDIGTARKGVSHCNYPKDMVAIYEVAKKNNYVERIEEVLAGLQIGNLSQFYSAWCRKVFDARTKGALATGNKKAASAYSFLNKFFTDHATDIENESKKIKTLKWDKLGEVFHTLEIDLHKRTITQL